MQWINFSKLVTIFVLTLAISTTQANEGKDGERGAGGRGGADGTRGTININWVPVDPNPQWFFYFPISQRNVAEFKKILATGTKINWPMSNIIGRPSPFQVTLEQKWVEGLKILFENPDPKNQPNLTTKVKTRAGLEVNIYEFLTIGEYLNPSYELADPKFHMRTKELEVLALILNAENDLDWLTRATAKVLSALTSEKNPFSQSPNNIAAKQLIEKRMKHLCSLRSQQ